MISSRKFLHITPDLKIFLIDYIFTYRKVIQEKEINIYVKGLESSLWKDWWAFIHCIKCHSHSQISFTQFNRFTLNNREFILSLSFSLSMHTHIWIRQMISLTYLVNTTTQRNFSSWKAVEKKIIPPFKTMKDGLVAQKFGKYLYALQRGPYYRVIKQLFW